MSPLYPPCAYLWCVGQHRQNLLNKCPSMIKEHPSSLGPFFFLFLLPFLHAQCSQLVLESRFSVRCCKVTLPSFLHLSACITKRLSCQYHVPGNQFRLTRPNIHIIIRLSLSPWAEEMPSLQLRGEKQFGIPGITQRVRISGAAAPLQTFFLFLPMLPLYFWGI